MRSCSRKRDRSRSRSTSCAPPLPWSWATSRRTRSRSTRARRIHRGPERSWTRPESASARASPPATSSPPRRAWPRVPAVSRRSPSPPARRPDCGRRPKSFPRSRAWGAGPRPAAFPEVGRSGRTSRRGRCFRRRTGTSASASRSVPAARSRSGRATECGRRARPLPTMRPGSRNAGGICPKPCGCWRPAISPDWARSPSAMRCACMPMRSPRIRRCCTGSPQPSPACTRWRSCARRGSEPGRRSMPARTWSPSLCAAAGGARLLP